MLVLVSSNTPNRTAARTPRSRYIARILGLVVGDFLRSMFGAMIGGNAR
ncbi:hypothetical protein [Paenibacillus sp. PAMC21692]|nr:hypothetical protein [Paenibacillus sp. PAMC21692]QNK54543.1 hypothetical protein H7F31_17935 [Paenibacillus sp. PAMC21692]